MYYELKNVKNLRKLVNKINNICVCWENYGVYVWYDLDVNKVIFSDCTQLDKQEFFNVYYRYVQSEYQPENKHRLYIGKYCKYDSNCQNNNYTYKDIKFDIECILSRLNLWQDVALKKAVL